jgi:LETM1 and EF-hand domain-containing protein 1
MFSTDAEGCIQAKDLKSALEVINHRPSGSEIEVLLGKLDPDGDGLIPLEDIVGLAGGEGLGIVMEEEGAVIIQETAQDIKAAATDATYVAPSGSGASTSTSSAPKDASAEKSETKEKKEEKVKVRKEDVVEG